MSTGKKRKTSTFSKQEILSGLFIGIVSILVLMKKIPLLILGIYVIASLASVVMYYIDKRAARTDNWRTPENTLHALAVVGGWPGALVAQHRFRHKTQKKSFRIVFWATVLLNCGILIGYVIFFVANR